MVAKDTIEAKDEQPGLFFTGAHVINSHRRCSGILYWNRPNVQVVSADASTKKVASALTTCT
jgi:hypothetical protein